jgi:hypothetical protein
MRYHDTCVAQVRDAMKRSLAAPRRITQLGMGQAKVDKVASNRRMVDPSGKVGFQRGSASAGDPQLAQATDGLVDPWLKTISFWDGDAPVCALSVYATHPMSYYGKGEVSADFPGLARRRRQADDTSVFQIYASGCSGDVTAGKYNDGSPSNRAVLADRIYQAMRTAWKETRRVPLEAVVFRSVDLILPPRNTGAFAVPELEKRLADPKVSTGQRVVAAMGLSWHRRSAARQPIDLPVIDFGPAQILLLPGESFVGFQLYAQSVRPDSFVMTVGYGECATGYIPTGDAEADRFDDTWYWIAPGAEPIMQSAIRAALKQKGN